MGATDGRRRSPNWAHDQPDERTKRIRCPGSRVPQRGALALDYAGAQADGE
jgi:hypothetical protein